MKDRQVGNSGSASNAEFSVGSNARILTGVYTGSVKEEFHARDFSEISKAYDSAIGTTLDQFIITRAEDALLNDRNELVIFDFGCGEGNLIRDIVSGENESGSITQFLADNPDFNLKIVGLTDAQNPESQGGIEEIAGNNQIDAQIIFWSVTRSQSVDKVFSEKSVPPIDMALATSSLVYLSPKAFEETVTSIVEKLSPGGVFLASEIGHYAPGTKSFNMNFNGPLDPQERNWKTMLRENAQAINVFRNFDPQILEGRMIDDEHFEKAKEILIKKGFLLPVYVKRTEEMIEAIYKDLTPDQRKAILINHVLNHAYDNIITKRKREDWTKKLSFLKNFSGVDIRLLDDKHGEEFWDSAGGFVIKKP